MKPSIARNPPARRVPDRIIMREHNLAYCDKYTHLHHLTGLNQVRLLYLETLAFPQPSHPLHALQTLMGQSPSTSLASPEVSRRDVSRSNRLNYRSWLTGGAVESSKDSDFTVNSAADLDYTADIPDDCLACIFQFLSSADRKRCSIVCQRWLRVDGQSRHRLSLNAQEELLEIVPSLFIRFDSVTKLTLRCDRRSTSINDDALIFISLRCSNLTRLKLRGCRDITEVGMAGLAKNCKALKKLSCGSCMFGAKGMNAVLAHCTVLEELSVKRLRGFHDGAEVGVACAAASSLKSICLKELINGQSFAPLIFGSKKLGTLKLIRCLGDWDKILETIGNFNNVLIEIHLEKIQVSDEGLLGVSNCSNLESLHIVKTPECSSVGLSFVAEKCKLLRKLHIDGWRTNRINDDGLISVAKHCPNLQELVLIGLYPTSLSLGAIASNCGSLERLALCGIFTIGDAEIECIAAKCMALRKLCIKGCPISNAGIEAIASGCPNLAKIKVKKCRKVTGAVVESLRKRRSSLVFNFEDGEVEALDGSGSDIGAHESTFGNRPIVLSQVSVADAPSSNNNNRLTMIRTRLGLLAGRNIVPSALRRWSNSDNISSSSI